MASERWKCRKNFKKLTAFLDKHNIPISDSIKKDIDELKDRIKYYEGKREYYAYPKKQ